MALFVEWKRRVLLEKKELAMFLMVGFVAEDRRMEEEKEEEDKAGRRRGVK